MHSSPKSLQALRRRPEPQLVALVIESEKRPILAEHTIWGEVAPVPRVGDHRVKVNIYKRGGFGFNEAGDSIQGLHRAKRGENLIMKQEQNERAKRIRIEWVGLVQ